MFIKKAILSLSFLALAPSMAMAASSWSVGAEYSEADYGTAETTTAWYLPVGWRYAGGDFSAGITVPYVSVSGPAMVSFDGRPLVPGGSGGGGPGGGGGGTTVTSRTASGVGDVLLSGGYQLLDGEGDSLWLNIGVVAKLGTADEEKGLGSGENDYTLQLEAEMGMVYGYVGYTRIGDTELVDYNDVASAALGLDIPLSPKHSLGLEYFTEQASLDGMEDLEEATVLLGGKMSEDLNYSLYYTAGLSDSCPDAVIGVNLSTPMR